jgi:hypothetical protein
MSRETDVRFDGAARPIAFLVACVLFGALLGGAVIATRGHSSPARTGVAAGTYSPAVTYSTAVTSAAQSGVGASPSPCPTLQLAETRPPATNPPGPSTTPDPSLVAALKGYYVFVDATHQTSIAAYLDATSSNYGAVTYWVVGVGYFGAKATVQHMSSSVDRVRFSGEGAVYPGAEGDILLPTWFEELTLLAGGTSQKVSFQIDATIDRVGLTATATLTYQGQAYPLMAVRPPDPRPAIDRVIELFNQGDWAGVYDAATPTVQKIGTRDAFACQMHSILATKYGATGMSVRLLSDPQVEGGHSGPWTATVSIEVIIDGSRGRVQGDSSMMFVYADRWLLLTTGDVNELTPAPSG